MKATIFLSFLFHFLLYFNPSNQYEIEAELSELTINQINSTSVAIKWSFKNHSDSLMKLFGFRVFVTPLEGNSPSLIQKMVFTTTYSTKMLDLFPEIHYSVNIYSLWEHSENVTNKKIYHLTKDTNFCFILQNSSVDSSKNVLMNNWKSNCICDFFGGKCSNVSDNNESRCSCDNDHVGPYCDQCARGFFRIQNGTCQPCKCDESLSDGTCYWDVFSNSAICSNCLRNSTGPRCETCPTGFFLSRLFCRPCNCSGSPAVCHEITGECLQCLNHTRGLQCEFCSDTRLSYAGAVPPFCEVPSSISGGVVLFLVILLSGMLLCFGLWIFLKRRKEARKRRAHILWTVEYDAAVHDDFDSSLPHTTTTTHSKTPTYGMDGHLQLKTTEEDQDNVYHSKVYA